jgi:DNA-directed RNA polymerase specialized sigma24 family protein
MVRSSFGSSQSTDGEIIFREQSASLRSALDRLPEEYQEIIRVRVLLELSTAERVLLHRALKALKREVEEGHE